MKLIASAAMKKVDTKAIGEMGIPEAVLIENAGRAVADAAAELLEDVKEKRIILFIGKGNNGGDGLAAARFLLKRGALVTLVLAEAPESFGAGAALQYKIDASFPFTILRWEKDQNDVLQACAQADLFVDALLGTSFHGKVREPIRSLLETLQMVPVPVLAVDIPSGVAADTGHTDVALHAQVTVTMIAPKPGLYLYPGAGYTGRIVLADLNTPPSLVFEAESRAELLTEDLVQHTLPKRPPNAHKGMNGRIGILAGSLGYAGAAELCSKAAVRAGAGLVTLYTQPEVLQPLIIKSTEVMVRPVTEASLKAFQSYDVVAAGPGAGKAPETVQYLRELLPQLQQPLVLDADGLNALAGDDALLQSLKQKIFTPHPGEMARLLGVPVSQVLEDPVAAAREGAKKWQAVVVLKCTPTIIAEPDGQIYINTTGNEGMATGGCGDVLTGTIAALLGQGLNLVRAACCGVYLHGLAGDLAAENGKIGLAAGDLLAKLPQAIARTQAK
ncbi:NAD(P)H-hydrate dehydratase [Acidaminococcus timonensis]|jgi:ADP-dependent NAD(P)H-hydrate dehydratase / NAD(P)H-hydrate epimerase|uniref:NAD(P)H-hydrate dehydratase n=1 Tax=Acidaminococcus timonensis TaxID=1871002 RepID=UPI003A5BCE06